MIRMAREEAIRILEINKPVVTKRASMPARKYAEAFKMAIASLKTDEVYQLEHENRDFVEIHKGMTNGDAIISLYPNLKYTIQNGRVVTTIGVASSFDLEWWNAPYKAEKGGE